MRSRVLFLGVIGALAGVLAAVVSALLMPALTLENSTLDRLHQTVDVSAFTWYDKPYGIVGHALLGICVSGLVATASLTVATYNRRLGAFLVAAPLGGGLAWLGAFASDRLYLHLVVEKFGSTVVRLDAPNRAAETAGLLWYPMVALGLSIPVFIALGFRKYYFIRALLGGVLAAGISYAVAQIVFMFVLPAVFVAAITSSSPEKLDIMNFVKPIYVGMLFGMGLGCGLAFAVAEAIYRPAWLTSRSGPTEGRKWPIPSPVARIGSLEGLEVRVPADGHVAPIHAQIRSSGVGHALEDLAGSTFVNGALAPAVWLHDGDQIQVGTSVLTFRTRLPAYDAVPPPARAPAAAQAAPAAVAPSPAIVDTLGRRHELREGLQVVGRGPECDIVLSFESSTSRRHAELRRQGGEVFVRDLGSTNGTYVNDVQISGEIPVRAGDRLRLGRAELGIEMNA